MIFSETSDLFEMKLTWSVPFMVLYKFFMYPLANEIAKWYSNATVRPSVLPSVRPSFRPSFRNILVITLESSISFNGFWPNLVHT